MSRLLLFLVSISLVLSYMNFLPRFFWWQETSQTLWLYYIILHLIIVVLIIATPARKIRAWRLCLAVILLSLGIYSSRIYRYYKPRIVSEGSRTIKVLFMEEPRGEVKALLTEALPDIVIVLYEKNPLEMEVSELESFPFSVSTAASNYPNFSLYSRNPFEGPLRTSVGQDMPPVLIANVAHMGGSVTFAAMHMLPPADKTSVFINDVFIRRAGTELRYLSGPVILLAAMHTVPFARVHGTLSRVSRMRNASIGHGLLPVWDQGIIAPFFPATHFFVKGGPRMVDHSEGSRERFNTNILSASFRY